MNKPNNKYRSKSNPPPRVQQTTPGESMTKQSFAKEANINNKVSQHLRQPGANLSNIGHPGPFARRPRWGEVPSASFHEMLNKVIDVQNQFKTLHPRLRGRFQNNPYQLIRFVEDPANKAEAVRLGLVENPDMLDAIRQAEEEADREASQAAQMTIVNPDPESVPPENKAPKGPKKV